jgi:phosphate-selective porin OprO/OprP
VSTKMIRALLLATFLFSAFAGAAEVSSGDQPSITILIENVRLIDNDAEQDPVVNIVIRNGELDIVTPDKVTIEELTLKVDAKRGFLLGKLELGTTPNFLVLDGDPRENFDILLDTKTHTDLAVEDGQLVLNRLTVSAATPTAEEKKQAGEAKQKWLAYQPPPLSMPTGYSDTKKWNRWESKYVDGLFAGAVALDRMRWTGQDNASETQVGEVKDFGGGEIRALRFGVVGTINFDNPWVYTVFGATSAFDTGFEESSDDDFQWFDVRVDIPTVWNTTLSVGKQKEPISMERIASLIFLPMQERPAAIDAMLPARNVGVVWSGNAAGTRMSWQAGIFNPWLDTDDSISNAPTQFVGRVTGVPWSSTDSSNLIHLGAGLRYSNAKAGVRYFTEPEFNQSPIYVDTGEIEADDAYTWDLEASWRKGPLWVSSEILRTRVDSPVEGKLNFSGYEISGVWALSGEMRSYNTRGGLISRPPVARSVYQNGWGAWEVMARYSYTDLTDGSIDGGKMDIWSLGGRWWLTPFLSLDLNWRTISLDRFGVTGDSQGFSSRLVISLE